jgi:hypothetical protein
VPWALQRQAISLDQSSRRVSAAARRRASSKCARYP